ncbi:MAG: TetR/AcrR family transcriptional regulator [Spirochaetales bacterium]|nr:TetR/AcrR family transcriptional regulator [Spirochaetales bacterium]
MNKAKIDLDALIEAAVAEFGRDGYSGARMDGIALAAGVNKALIYYHVGDKQKLFEVVLERVLNVAAAEINNKENLKADFTPLEYLENYINGFYRFFIKNPGYPPVLIRELLAGGVHINRELSKPLMGLLSPLIEQVEKGIQQGIFRPVSPFMIHMLVVSGLNALIIGSPLFRAFQPEIDGDSFKQMFIEILMNGIRKNDE